MVIESLSLYYHLACFICSRCSCPLGDGQSDASVQIKRGLLYCRLCYRAVSTIGRQTRPAGASNGCNGLVCDQVEVAVETGSAGQQHLQHRPNQHRSQYKNLQPRQQQQQQQHRRLHQSHQSPGVTKYSPLCILKRNLLTPGWGTLIDGASSLLFASYSVFVFLK
ncbi:unnamed protein product [Protopolystoma xenopodis]|uniref:LIM zinc-binding domain-containing protein n=1 Tax=Protopolystoma xenopodis TaxID=117903 RepID=A0A3S5CMS0_9PLAT|nr:unnamed protein product [Protopolystoma xenopodis]